MEKALKELASSRGNPNFKLDLDMLETIEGRDAMED